jgi:hypothetical protein
MCRFSWILGNSFLIESVTSTEVGKCKDDTASFVNAMRGAVASSHDNPKLFDRNSPPRGRARRFGKSKFACMLSFGSDELF